MDASAGSSPPRHSQGDAPRRGGPHRGKGPAVEIRQGEDDFMFAHDTFPALPDFPCLSSPSSSTFSSSSSSNSSSAFTRAVGAGGRGGESARGEPSEPAAAGDGMDDLSDIDHLLDFASINEDVPWDDEPLFPDVGMMLEDVISEQQQLQPPAGHGTAGRTASHAAAGGGEDAFTGGGGTGSVADDLPRFFMEWLKNNRDCISAEDLRSIRLRRSTIEAAAARLGGGRQGTMQLLKLILTWVQNHHLQKKRPRVGAMDQEAPPAGGQLPSPGANPGYEFPTETGAAAATSWMPYQAFSPTGSYGGEAIYPFQQGCSTSSVGVSSQPFSPPAAPDMHAGAWPLQYAVFVPAGATSAGTQTYPMPPPGAVPQPFAAPGFAGQFPQRMEPAATREARKKRMARQRRLSCLQQQRSQQLNLSQIQTGGFPQGPPPRAAHSAPVTPPSSGWGGLWTQQAVQGQPHGQLMVQVPNPLSTKSNSSRQKQQKPSPDAAARSPSGGAATPRRPGQAAASDKQRQQGARTPAAAPAAGDKNLRFLLQKVLKQSDVGTLGRIVLPKKEAETHLPELKTGDGISIPIEDIGTSQVWSMRYRFWPNNKSRMYLLENTGDFVRSNELQEGDFIVLYSDVKSGKYLIRGVKVRAQQDLAKHKNASPEKGGASDVKAGGEDGGCKEKPPHGVRRSRQEAASMNQMAVSI
uniref:VIVIPAROUS1 protein n=1 Tax=Triticum monococcum subsp. aegilopoides TaxID=52163 RepID=H6TY26_TRIMO|nr:VIVIPAROUS1 protein [Triticum monococcum subsp. aegilopoides]